MSAIVLDVPAAATVGDAPENLDRLGAGAAGQANDAASCCARDELSACCQPSAKASCCGAAPVGSCGCR